MTLRDKVIGVDEPSPCPELPLDDNSGLAIRLKPSDNRVAVSDVPIAENGTWMIMKFHDRVVARRPKMNQPHSREKFATQMDRALLSDLRALAKVEGRQLQSLLEEAVGNLIAERQKPRPDISVKDALKASMRQYGPLYKKLAE
ncbi:hypothetical protein [Asticcacaulis excentricus]|nr:hypothetical protein [Asticcacaulis excentricus]